MNDVFIPKLKQYLANPIVTEEQVLYVLVQLRKILEYREYPKDQYVPVRFICDWVVHSRLDRTGWGREILLFFDAIVIDGKTWNQLTSLEQKKFQSILGLEALREGLMNFLKSESIPPVAICHPFGWRLFLESFVALVAGCPLKLKGDATSSHAIDRVTVRMETEENLASCAIVWTFVRRDQRLFNWVLPIIVERCDYHFGRDGKAIDEAFEAKLIELGVMTP